MFSWSRISPLTHPPPPHYFMEPKSTLKNIAQNNPLLALILSHMNPFHDRPSNLRTILILSFYISLGFPSDILSFRFSHQNPVYLSTISSKVNNKLYLEITLNRRQRAGTSVWRSLLYVAPYLRPSVCPHKWCQYKNSHKTRGKSCTKKLTMKILY